MTTLTWDRSEASMATMTAVLLRLLKWSLVPALCLGSFAFVYILSWQHGGAGPDLAAMVRTNLAEIFGDAYVVELFFYRAVTVLAITLVVMVLSGIFERPARKMKVDVLTSRLMVMFGILVTVFAAASLGWPEVLGLQPVGAVIFCALVVMGLESVWMHRRGLWLDGPRVGRWQQRQQAKLLEPYEKRVKQLDRQLESYRCRVEALDHQIAASNLEVRDRERQLECERRRCDLLAGDLAARLRDTYASCVSVRRGRRIFRIAIAQVRRLQSEGAELRVHLQDGTTYLGRGALRDMLRNLDPRQFIAVSRSEALRRDEIDFVEQLPSGRRVVVTRQGERLAVPRSRWSDFEADLFDGARL